MSERLPELAAGVYRHYKGPLYLVLGYGHDANAEGREVVVYVGLELDEAKTGPRLAVRDAAEFLGYLHGDDGSSCPGFGLCDDLRLHVRRFVYLGPSWEGQRA